MCCITKEKPVVEPKPHKCPVCKGTGVAQPFEVVVPLFNGSLVPGKYTVTGKCPGCGGRGIVWAY